MGDIGNQQIFLLLSEVRDDVKATAATVSKLEIHVEGNGGKGLLQRQDAGEERLDILEEWKGKRPIICPATAKEITKGLARMVTFASGILAIIIALSVLGSRWLGYTKAEKLQEQMKTLQESLEKLTE
jgi:hypothetical protein